MEAMNETHQAFLTIIKPWGFITKKMLGSSINVINFSTSYLICGEKGSMMHYREVRERWFVVNSLTIQHLQRALSIGT